MTGRSIRTLRRKGTAAFGRAIKQDAVSGTEAIIDESIKRGTSRNLLAAKLATAYYETAHTMQPIHERGQRSCFAKYEPGTRRGGERRAR